MEDATLPELNMWLSGLALITYSLLLWAVYNSWMVHRSHGLAGILGVVALMCLIGFHGIRLATEVGSYD
jgi:hypothetical protein